ncbi:MAG: hypothetical protein ACP5OA_01890, partial [Candidatus Woesearchaeota archaeon]
MDRKKGQVTVFIILGIVLIIIIGLSIYLVNSSKDKKISPPDILVSEKFLPIHEFVQQCVTQIATEAIIKLGQHGGYIDMDNTVLSGMSFDMRPFEQYDSHAAFVSPSDANSEVAYWFYSDSVSGCDNCRVGTLAPSLVDMERQISQYVSINMDSCLQNFSM